MSNREKEQFELLDRPEQMTNGLMDFRINGLQIFWIVRYDVKSRTSDQTKSFRLETKWFNVWLLDYFIAGLLDYWTIGLFNKMSKKKEWLNGKLLVRPKTKSFNVVLMDLLLIGLAY